jgi:hypothetical protein
VGRRREVVAGGIEDVRENEAVFAGDRCAKSFGFATVAAASWTSTEKVA